MGNVLAYCESTGTGLRSNALAAIACARQAAEHHGGDVVIALIGSDLSAAAEAAARYATKVLVVDDAGLAHYMAETYAVVLAKLVGEAGASAFVTTAGAVGKDLIPRVAGLLDVSVASDIAKVESKNTYRRPILAGNAHTIVQIDSDPVGITARQSEFDAAAELDGAGEVVAVAAGDLDAKGAEFVKIESSKSDRPDLNDADIVISGGRGMKNGENFKHLEEICDIVGAAMGASRAATDAGYVPADLQVGQTGKVVAPNLYIAVAISGAIQHLAGMKNSKTIVAINKDPDAPIFQIADYGLVTTWEKALPELKEALAAHKAAQS